MQALQENAPEKIFPESSVIEYLIYREDTRMLEVQYRMGKYRVYPDIRESDLTKVLKAKSVGRALLEMVRSRREPPKEPSFLKKIFRA